MAGRPRLLLQSGCDYGTFDQEIDVFQSIIVDCLSIAPRLSCPPSVYLSQLSGLFPSLRDAQRSSGRSGGRLHQGETIKTTADWNRLLEQQCKLK